MGKNVRTIALSLLLKIGEEGVFCHIALREALAEMAHFDVRDRAFLRRLVSGTLERQLALDFIIDHYADMPVARMRPLIRYLLRMGAYQIIHMEQIPDRAACDEAVKLARSRGFASLAGFVNAILRSIAREKDALPWPQRLEGAGQSLVHFLSIHYAMPEWLIEKWLQVYDGATVEAILAGSQAMRPLTVCLAAGLGEARIEGWLADLATAGVTARSCSFPFGAEGVTSWPGMANVYQLSDVHDVAALPGFAEGLFMVMDVASILAGTAAGVEEGDRVVDVCAAPGGKAIYAAARAGKVIARDISAAKCRLIEENAARMGVGNIEIVAHDATVLDPSLVAWADVVIADLPCSGLGVMARKPDIRQRATAARVEAVCELQRRILAVVWQYVRPGGVLVYSTCTISREENEGMMGWFVANHPFRYEGFPADSPLRGMQGQGTGDSPGEVQLLPGVHGCDGFYVCRLRRGC